jgi:hypothetical protein
MRRRRRLAVAASALAVVALVVVVILAGGAGARGSTASRGAGGWLAARRYLEARGARVTLITEPLGAYVAAAGGGGQGGPGPVTGNGTEARAGVLALVFPWQGAPAGELSEALDAHLGRGGDLLIAYSGEAGGDEQSLDFWSSEEPAFAPVNPWRWYRFVHREWDLRSPRPAGRAAPAAGAAPRRQASSRQAVAAPPVRVWAPRELPVVRAAAATVLYTSPAGRPVAWIFRRHGGRVVLLPADALSNSRLALAGNSNLLEALLQNLGRRWAFDEYHHGLGTVAPSAPGLGRAANLLTVHLALLYLLAAAALARRQGPAWPVEVPLTSSAPGFLLGIGALHHRLGHHRDAARLLLRRVRELDRGIQLPDDLDRRAESAGPEELVAVARQVALLRGGSRRASAGEPR